MRFHVPGIPGRPLTKEHSQCAYTQKVRKFGEMMGARDHEVFLYGPEEHDDFEGVTYVECYPDAEPMEYDLERWAPFNQSALVQIRRRMEKHDFLCLVGGRSQMNIADSALLTCEPFVGYEGIFTQYRAFESYAWMHTVYGMTKGAHAADGEFYDAVIPNYFDVNDDDFPLETEKDDYLLFMGRMINRKGVGIAADVAERLGMRLILAGEGPDVPAYGEHVGLVGPAERAELMGRARAFFCPTIYVEPFGAVAVEAQLMGTPVIATDWGAFTETVNHGVSGYRCRTLAEFMQAVEHLDDLAAPELIRMQAFDRWSYDAIAPQFEQWYGRLATLWDQGWYTVEAAT